jgi:hypothetical protein
MSGTLRTVTVLLAFVFVMNACTTIPKTTIEPLVQPERILCIGNSLFFFNGGVDFHIMELAGSANPPKEIVVERYFMPDATLFLIWQMPDPHEMIANGNYDVVVLQEWDNRITENGNNYEYIRLWVEEIRATGAVPVLYMTAAEVGRKSIDEISRNHEVIAKELGMHVAPLGLAWQRVNEERPDLNLYLDDELHPNIYGTYLGASVLYATLFDESPESFSYIAKDDHIPPQVISEEEATYLQRIAWEMVKEYQGQE